MRRSLRSGSHPEARRRGNFLAPPLCNDIHRAAKQLFQFRQQAAHVQESTPSLHDNQEIYIALLASVMPRDGTKHTHIVRTMLCCDPEDLCAMGYELLIYSHKLSLFQANELSPLYSVKT